VHCTDTECRAVAARARRLALLTVVCAVAALLGCAKAPSSSAPARVPAPAAAPAPVAAAPAPAAPGGNETRPSPPGRPAASPPATPADTADRGPIPAKPRYVKLGPPATPRSEAALRVQLAQRLIDAHPDSSYTTRPPERLLAIPVLEIDLNADGSVRDIKVLRKPSTGNQATVLAIAAVRRAAPYGDVSRLPKPWRVVETFLFDDHLRFKPRTLDTD
jgi:hypothetical protein